jgi:hypothetical protein
VVDRAGAVTVANGAVRPVVGRRVMVVSDLDGTMVGDDGATQAFRCHAGVQVPQACRSLLVTSTATAVHKESTRRADRRRGWCLDEHEAISRVGNCVQSPCSGVFAFFGRAGDFT